VLSPEARAEWERWKEETRAREEGERGEGQHDTIGLIVRDAHGNIAAGKGKRERRKEID
jgi:isoaspartyl peptidase/L-asparaginase-like protein (Ntn-hydrolase superfamily)